MKNILLLTTGGTIACTRGASGYAPTLSGEALLEYVPQVRKYAHLHVQSLLNKDSTNMEPRDWIVIADAIFDHWREYDGIVVLHGTDTMAYSASAVSFMTLGIKIPVVFTGSQYPAGQPGSDAPRNLADAICTACKYERGGVLLTFDGTVFNGCCVSKVSTSELHAFESCGGAPVGHVQNRELQVITPPHRDVRTRRSWQRSLDSRVLFLKITPGMDGALLDLAALGHYPVVVLEGFGLGGIPSGENGLLERISQLRQREILVVVTTQCSRGRCDMTVYEAGQAALEHGALCSSVISKEALLTKLMWILAQTQTPDEIEQMLFHDFCGELGTNFSPIDKDEAEIV